MTLNAIGSDNDHDITFAHNVPAFQPALISAAVALPSTILASVCTVLPRPISCSHISYHCGTGSLTAHICQDPTVLSSRLSTSHPPHSPHLVWHEPHTIGKSFDDILALLHLIIPHAILSISHSSGKQFSHMLIPIALVSLPVCLRVFDLVQIEDFALGLVTGRRGT